MLKLKLKVDHYQYQSEYLEVDAHLLVLIVMLLIL